MHPSIPRSIMKHMCMYEKRICFLKIILHQYINDPLGKIGLTLGRHLKISLFPVKRPCGINLRLHPAAFFFFFFFFLNDKYLGHFLSDFQTVFTIKFEIIKFVT